MAIMVAAYEGVVVDRDAKARSMKLAKAQLVAATDAVKESSAEVQP